ncbi:exported hypothetical protein [Thiomonas sp. CB3]|nr:exported hypothetical protein [Thiomonas sp. CB3]
MPSAKVRTFSSSTPVSASTVQSAFQNVRPMRSMPRARFPPTSRLSRRSMPNSRCTGRPLPSASWPRTTPRNGTASLTSCGCCNAEWVPRWVGGSGRQPCEPVAIERAIGERLLAERTQSVELLRGGVTCRRSISTSVRTPGGSAVAVSGKRPGGRTRAGMMHDRSANSGRDGRTAPGPGKEAL